MLKREKRNSDNINLTLKTKTMKFKIEDAQVKDHYYLTIEVDGVSTKTYYLERSECRHLIETLDNKI